MLTLVSFNFISSLKSLLLMLYLGKLITIDHSFMSFLELYVLSNNLDFDQRLLNSLLKTPSR